MNAKTVHDALEPGEYVIGVDHANGADYTVFLHGRRLKDVIGVIRYSYEEAPK